MSQIQAKWDAERAQQMAAQAEEQMKARQREQALQALVDKQRGYHRNEVNRIVSRYNADLERLRDRPEARAGDSGVPQGADAGVGCTGRGLARLDAELLTGYASAAARLQSALTACQTAYDEVRRSVNGE